jgi:hypothetical protein
MKREYRFALLEASPSFRTLAGLKRRFARNEQTLPGLRPIHAGLLVVRAVELSRKRQATPDTSIRAGLYLPK